ncbi:MAG TPA: Ig-like domain-containing domain [Puia sp.]|nr:Ig-like domain-containing domain [Puia sp.]
MKIKSGLFFFSLICTVLIGTTGNTGCANIVPPLGGPRDTIPPVLVSVSPRDSSYHFNANKIVFNFDEYIDAKDMHEQLIISPVPKVDPIIDYKLRTLTVRIKDTLQPNTTYFFDFGNAIHDYNEENILKHFSYVFSTGGYIDSAGLSGKVIVAATGKPDSTLIVMLHRKLDDSAVVKEKPRYITRVDTNGLFSFRYLQPGTYALYAMKDEGGTRRYLSRSQLFAFSDSPVVVGRPNNPITLYAYAEATETRSSTKTTTGAKTPTKTPEKSKEKEKDRRLQFQTNVGTGDFDVLDTVHLQFTNTLQVMDPSKIRFTDRDYTDINASLYHFKADSTNRLFWLFYPWKLDTKYHLILNKDFAQDSAGRKLLKTDTISFQTKNETQYGEVRIRIPKLDLSRHPVLQFVQNDVVKFSYIFSTQKEFRSRLFTPGEYELHILYDRNRNGVWDAGEFFYNHCQPEIIQIIRRKFNVKGNWDNDTEIGL